MSLRYWTRIIDAFFFALNGLKHAIKHERAFQQELLLCTVLIPLAFYVEVGATERILLIASLLWILSVELLNSAIETAINRISQERHPVSKIAKDLGAAAVLISLVMTGYVWASILL